MYDKELVEEILSQVYQSALTILARFEPVKSIDDFTGSPPTSNISFRPPSRNSEGVVMGRIISFPCGKVGEDGYIDRITG